MQEIHKKYLEDFEKLQRDWEKLKLYPSQQCLNSVIEDMAQMQRDLKHLKF